MNKASQKIKETTESMLFINKFEAVQDKIETLDYVFSKARYNGELDYKTMKVYATLLECDVDDICFTDFKPEKNSCKVCPYKFILGDADFANVKDLGELKLITGKVDFRESKVDDLKMLTYIGGSANFGGTEIESLGNLHYIGGNLGFRGELASEYWETKVVDLGRLKYVGGNFDGFLMLCKSLNNLEYVKGTLNLSNARNLKDLGKLHYVGNDFKIFRTKVQSLGNLNFIGGNATIGPEIEDLGKLKIIVGDCTDLKESEKDFDLSNVFIGGDALNKKRYQTHETKEMLECMFHDY